MAPGIAHLVSPDDTFHAYFDPTSASSMLSALVDLDTLIAESDPPYDAILGFSQGSCLAATMLLRDDGPQPPFKLAVFLSAGMAADYQALEHGDGKVQMLRGKLGGERINIPTVHVYGENDSNAPGQGGLLRDLCQEEGRQTAVHRLGHQVPGGAERQDLDKAVAAIKRAIEAAQGGIGG